MSSNRRRPNTIVVGAPKSGTTSLCDALARHPDVFMPQGKETHFFNWYYEDRGIGWYESIFEKAPVGSHLLEGTPDYAMSNWVDDVAHRISEDIPEAKIIYMVREPVKRLESHYVQMIANGRPNIGINNAIKEWPELLGTSLYWDVYSRLIAKIPKENVFILFLEDYKKDSEAAHRDVLEFMGLDMSEESMAPLKEAGQSNSRDTLGTDNALLAMLRNQPWFLNAKARLPRRLLAYGRSKMIKPVSVEIKWDPEMLQFVQEETAKDWKVFRSKFRAQSVAAPA